MSSIAVIYWSMTGNTQAMAEAIAKGAREAGAQVDVFSVDQVGVDQVLEYDQLALGCPAMGAEVLLPAGGPPERKVCGPLRLLRLGRRAVDARLGGADGPRRGHGLPGGRTDPS